MLVRGGIEPFVLAGEMEGEVGVEVTVVFTARSLRTASAPHSPHLAPVISRRSPMRCLHAPSIGPVAIGQPSANAVS